MTTTMIARLKNGIRYVQPKQPCNDASCCHRARKRYPTRVSMTIFEKTDAQIIADGAPRHPETSVGQPRYVSNTESVEP
jgi:hypothetical protein